jgi:hypothetical protein
MGVIVLSVIKPNVVMPSVIMLNVVASCGLYYKHILTIVSDDRK